MFKKIGKALSKAVKGVAKGVGKAAKQVIKAAPTVLPMAIPGPWGIAAGAITEAIGGKSKGEKTLQGAMMSMLPDFSGSPYMVGLPTFGGNNPVLNAAMVEMMRNMGYLEGLRDWETGYGQGALKRVPDLMNFMALSRMMYGSLLPQWMAYAGMLPQGQQPPNIPSTEDILNQIFGGAI